MTREEYLKEIDNVSSFDKEAVLKIVQISKLYIKSLEEQNQGLQSLLDFKQQEISVLESKVVELEEKDKIGFQALNCSQCQGAGCPLCGGSGFVFGKNLYKYHTEDRICGNCEYGTQTALDGIVLCVLGAHIFGRKARMERVKYFCADFKIKQN